MIEKKTLWNDAGRAGLILGGVCVAYMLCNFLLGKVGGDNKIVMVLASLVSFLLWAVKFGACLFLMRFFMKKFASENPEVTNSETFRFGCAVAVLSALIYSAAYMAYVMFIAPDTFSQAIEVMADNPMITSEMMELMEQIIPKMPTMTFFLNFFYCWMFGNVLSAIYSRNIPSTNPFKNNTTDEQ